MFIGTLVYTDRFEQVLDLLNRGFTVLVISDDITEYSAFTDKKLYQMASLLPPSESIRKDIDGDVELSAAIYLEHLCNTCNSTFGAIFSAMINGKDIALYIPKDLSEGLVYPSVLIDYILNEFGIMVPYYLTRPCRLECNFNKDKIIELLFACNHISLDKLCSSISNPNNLPLYVETIDRFYDMGILRGQPSAFTTERDRAFVFNIISTRKKQLEAEGERLIKVAEYTGVLR